jgi:hypothetical protein
LANAKHLEEGKAWGGAEQSTRFWRTPSFIEFLGPPKKVFALHPLAIFFLDFFLLERMSQKTYHEKQ